MIGFCARCAVAGTPESKAAAESETNASHQIDPPPSQKTTVSANHLRLCSRTGLDRTNRNGCKLHRSTGSGTTAARRHPRRLQLGGDLRQRVADLFLRRLQASISRLSAGVRTAVLGAALSTSTVSSLSRHLEQPDHLELGDQAVQLALARPGSVGSGVPGGGGVVGGSRRIASSSPSRSSSTRFSS